MKFFAPVSFSELWFIISLHCAPCKDLLKIMKKGVRK